MQGNVYLYIVTMAGITYLIRMLPLTLLRRQIKNPYIRSFFYYVPYVTLSVMTFPAILWATNSYWSGLAGFIAALALAYRGNNLLYVALAASAAVFAVELILR